MKIVISKLTRQKPTPQVNNLINRLNIFYEGI